MKEITPSGLYIIKDQYFADYPNDKYMQNKGENRPHYYAIKDSTGLYWMIPISSKVDKFRAKIADVEAKAGSGNCFLFAVAPVSGKERAFIISEMFPVTEDYILRPYTVNGKPYVIENGEIQKMLSKKARRFLSMVERGNAKSPVDAMKVKKQLLAALHSKP